MDIFIGSYWNNYTDEWQIDEDAIFLNEADAKAWAEESQQKLVQARIDERNRHERENYERNIKSVREHNALVVARLRKGLRQYPTPPVNFTEPQWKVQTCFTYEKYEAK